jgi:hypothetical protein
MRIGVAIALGAGGGIRVAAKSEAQIGRILHGRRQGQNVVEFASSLLHSFTLVDLSILFAVMF